MVVGLFQVLRVKNEIVLNGGGSMVGFVTEEWRHMLCSGGDLLWG